ncbi:MAG: shikimate dehydrogenase [Sphingobacteriales bacterium]|nr:shikimate dehydrogenase [Sphingobacteriales bacterium]
MNKVYGIIGYPLTHSFSQKYFSEKFLQEGLSDCRYEVFPLTDINAFPALIISQPELLGLSVTIPHKQTVIALLDHTDGIPSGLHACNCIKLMDGKTYGFNTDIIGFEGSLVPLLHSGHRNALVLGNGGAAEAVRFVLDKLGITHTTVSRSATAETGLTYAALDKALIEKNTLIINTTPLGTFPNVEACAAIPYEFLGKQHLLYDLVYNPAQTLFLEKGAAQGAQTKNGYEMLLIQAEESWRIWNDR